MKDGFQPLEVNKKAHILNYRKGLEEKMVMAEQYERQVRKLRLKPKTICKNGKQRPEDQIS